MLLPRLVRIFALRPQLSRFSKFPRRYIMPPVPTSLPIVISGPSGVGKGTLYSLLLEKHPGIFTTSISHTTRAPRPGEERGVHYHYVSMQEFEDLIGKEGFVEHAMFGGNRYGTSRKMIEEKTAEGKVVVLDIEMEGVKQIKKSPLQARYVFIAPPSMEELEKRLRGRGTEKEESIQKRLAQAKNELGYSKTEGVHDLIIVNDDLDKAYKELEDFVFSTPKMTQEQSAKDTSAAGVSVQD